MRAGPGWQGTAPGGANVRSGTRRDFKCATRSSCTARSPTEAGILARARAAGAGAPACRAPQVLACRAAALHKALHTQLRRRLHGAMSARGGGLATYAAPAHPPAACACGAGSAPCCRAAHSTARQLIRGVTARETLRCSGSNRAQSALLFAYDDSARAAALPVPIRCAQPAPAARDELRTHAAGQCAALCRDTHSSSLVSSSVPGRSRRRARAQPRAVVRMAVSSSSIAAAPRCLPPRTRFSGACCSCRRART